MIFLQGSSHLHQFEIFNFNFFTFTNNIDSSQPIGRLGSVGDPIFWFDFSPIDESLKFFRRTLKLTRSELNFCMPIIRFCFCNEAHNFKIKQCELAN